MAPTGNEIVTKFTTRVPGKTVLITGPSENGVGAETAKSLALGRPKLIILAGRDQSKIQPVIDQIAKKSPEVAITYVPLDLASQSSVREAAKLINALVEHLDILINNAGVMAIEKYTTTPNGVELQFGVNHIGHFLLTKLLMSKLLAARDGARVINVSSFGYICSGIRDDWNFRKEAYNSWRAYGQSKTANILFAAALAKKLKGTGVLAFSLNPGLIPGTQLQESSAVTQERFMEGYQITLEALNGAPMPTLVPKSLEEGSATSVYAALSADITPYSGSMLSDCEIYHDVLPHALGEGNEDKLWALSEEIIGEKFGISQVELAAKD